MLIAAWAVDLRRWRGGDFAFWLHLFGLMAFWGGLTEQHSGAEFGKAIYCLVNVALIFLALFLDAAGLCRVWRDWRDAIPGPSRRRGVP